MAIPNFLVFWGHAFTDCQRESTLSTNLTKPHGLITWRPSIWLYLTAPSPLSLSLSPPSQSQPQTSPLSFLSIFSHQAHLTVHHWPLEKSRRPATWAAPCVACTSASCSSRWPSSTSSMAVARTSTASRRSKASTRYAVCRRDACVLSGIVRACVMLACWCMHASLMCIDVCMWLGQHDVRTCFGLEARWLICACVLMRWAPRKQ